jgi:hypothetical protein
MTATRKQRPVADGAASGSNRSSAALPDEWAGSLSERSGGSRRPLAQDDAPAPDLGYWDCVLVSFYYHVRPIRSSARPCP